jgi:hypothetical protein
MGRIFVSELIHDFLVILLIIMKCGRPEFLKCEPPVAEFLRLSISVVFLKKKCVLSLVFRQSFCILLKWNTTSAD